MSYYKLINKSQKIVFYPSRLESYKYTQSADFFFFLFFYPIKLPILFVLRNYSYIVSCSNSLNTPWYESEQNRISGVFVNLTPIMF